MATRKRARKCGVCKGRAANGRIKKGWRLSRSGRLCKAKPKRRRR